MPRKYTRISTRAASYTTEDLETAINKIKNKELSYAAASRMYGIPTSTLNDRVLKKTGIASNTLGRPRAIPLEMEIKLANCLRTMEKWGWGLSREEVIDITEQFVNTNRLETPFKNGKPGSDWFTSFRRRHNLSIKKPQPVEYLRKRMTDPFIVHEYFTLLEKTLHELNITDPKRIWNLDETSVCIDPTKTKVVGPKGHACTRTTSGSAKENITVLTIVNADGGKLNPLIVFKGKHMYKQWMIENSKEYDFELAYAASKRCWMETEFFYNYLLNIIIPNLGEERPILLIYDGHVSHVDDKVVALAVENNIAILKLPAHTSHLLQPLDLALFKSFKTTWDKNLVKWQRENVGSKIRKQCFARMFAKAWQDTNPNVIKNGFRKGGIYPFNPDVIPKEKFDPAAYARWKKHMTQANLKQPKTLKELCLHEMNNAIATNSAALEQSKTIASKANSDIPNSQHITFEELLLQKIAQQTQNTNNRNAVKLKRVAKGGEVITSTFVQNQQEVLVKKNNNEIPQKKSKVKTKSVLNKEQTNLAIPGPSQSRTKPKFENTASATPILIDKTNSVKYRTKKGKGIGKKTRTENVENFPPISTDDGKYLSNAVSDNIEDLTIFDDLKSDEKSGLPKTQKEKKKKKPMKKCKKSPSIDTTNESIVMSVHSDSDLFDTLSDILDCDIFHGAEDFTREQEIESIIKEFRKEREEMPIFSTCGESDELEENLKINSKDASVQEKVGKVTILSSVKCKPETLAFYGNPGNLHLIDKNADIYEIQKRKRLQNTGKAEIPWKKIKKEKNQTKPEDQTNTDNINLMTTKTKNQDEEEDNGDLKTYRIGDTVLVRYYKKAWKYYIGIVENFSTNTGLYTISYYKTIGKKSDVKFVIPKRKDHDTVPNYNIVKAIELIQFKEDPVEFTLMDDDDATYF